MTRRNAGSTLVLSRNQYPMQFFELATILLAHGVARVAVTADDVTRYAGVPLPDGVQVHDRDEIVAVQEDLRSRPVLRRRAATRSSTRAAADADAEGGHQPPHLRGLRRLR